MKQVTVGQYVSEFLKSKNMLCSTASQRTGISESTLSRLCSNKITLSTHVAAKLSEIGIDLEALFKVEMEQRINQSLKIKKQSSQVESLSE